MSGETVCPKLNEDGECPFGIGLPAACTDCRGDIEYKLEQQELKDSIDPVKEARKSWVNNYDWTKGRNRSGRI